MEKQAKQLPDELAKLEKATLIALLIHQGELLQKLWQENEALKKRLEELDRESKRQAAPFRMEEKSVMPIQRKPELK